MARRPHSSHFLKPACRGFSLIEVMIALTLVTLASLGLSDLSLDVWSQQRDEVRIMNSDRSVSMFFDDVKSVARFAVDARPGGVPLPNQTVPGRYAAGHTWVLFFVPMGLGRQNTTANDVCNPNPGNNATRTTCLTWLPPDADMQAAGHANHQVWMGVDNGIPTRFVLQPNGSWRQHNYFVTAPAARDHRMRVFCRNVMARCFTVVTVANGTGGFVQSQSHSLNFEEVSVRLVTPQQDSRFVADAASGGLGTLTIRIPNFMVAMPGTQTFR
jgi:prepilin-type N-terminal cleavage/methylation domain-containing protein